MKMEILEDEVLRENVPTLAKEELDPLNRQEKSVKGREKHPSFPSRNIPRMPGIF